jgi:hypothetical protein
MKRYDTNTKEHDMKAGSTQLWTVIAIAACLVMSGCIDQSKIVEVNKDGTATVTETTFMSQEMINMMNGIGQSMGGNSNAVPANPLLDKAKYTAEAMRMGEGVKLASIKELKEANKGPGVEVKYTVEDISKIRVAPGDLKEKGPIAGGSSDFITFDMVKGDIPKLTIHLPFETKARTADAKAPQQTAGELSMIKQMLKDMRISLKVKLNGEIVKSNGAYIDMDPVTKKQQAIVLYDIGFSKMLDDNTYNALLSLQDQPRSLLLKELAKNGMKIETADKVEVEFK